MKQTRIFIDTVVNPERPFATFMQGDRVFFVHDELFEDEDLFMRLTPWEDEEEFSDDDDYEDDDWEAELEEEERKEAEEAAAKKAKSSEKKAKAKK